METIYDKEIVEFFIQRISMIDKNQKPVWGKMTPAQMMRHCVMNEEMLQGKVKYNRLFFGRLFGARVLTKLLKDSSVLPKNQPTHPTFKMKGEFDFDAEKSAWINLLQNYGKINMQELQHPFFGRMTVNEIGWYAYKHTDHHLRQFNV